MIRDLIGTSLRINDKMVIDKHANVITSNLFCDFVHSHIVTPSICERNALEGIVVLGDVRINQGNSLWTCQIDSPTAQLDIHVDELAVFGNIVTPLINTKHVSTVSVGTPSGAYVTVKHGLETPVVRVNQLTTTNGGAVNVVGAGLNIVSGVISVPKTMDTTSSPSNVLTSSTMSGQLLFTCRVDVANGQRESVRLLNGLVTPTSLVFAMVGRYNGSGMPIVQSTVVTAGTVDIFLTNNDLSNPIGRNTIVPIQYLILA